MKYILVLSNSLAIFSLLNLSTDTLTGLIKRLQKPQRWLPAYLQPTQEVESKTNDREIAVMLYGWAGRDIHTIQFLAGGCGILLVFLVFPSTPLVALLGGLAYFLPGILAAQQRQQAQWSYLRQVQQLIDYLHLTGNLQQSLTWGLRDALSSIVPGESLLFDRLRYHLERQGSLEGPLSALSQLSTEFQLRELEDLTARLDAVQDIDDTTLRSTLREATIDIGQEISLRIQTHIEEAPVRLLFPIMVGLFPPTILLLFYPTLVTLMTGMTY